MAGCIDAASLIAEIRILSADSGNNFHCQRFFLLKNSNCFQKIHIFEMMLADAGTTVCSYLDIIYYSYLKKIKLKKYESHD